MVKDNKMQSMLNLKRFIFHFVLKREDRHPIINEVISETSYVTYLTRDL